jgi:hypothetical protein
MPTVHRTARLTLAAATTALAAVAAFGAPGAATAAAPKFSKPQKLTVDANVGGYEPGVVVDKYGNIVVTAHKQNHSLVLSPDSRSATKVRSMSWIWWSKDNGKTFKDMPGLTAAEEQSAMFGDEGDLATDATGHIYFVDTNVADVTFSRWHADGRGELELEAARPIGPMGEPVDDRPWLAAHGDGVVMYLGNMGNKGAYPAGTAPVGGQSEPANGPGRFTAYMSYDHGDTFDVRGYTLNDSGWCRPLADKRPGSKTFYVLCSNDGGKHYAYVTTDDGHHFKRYDMGTYETSSWINGAVAKDGTIYAMYHDSDDDKLNHLKLYTSKTQGRTWTKKDITVGAPGKIAYSWMDVAPDGTLGIAYYFSKDGKNDWNVWAGTAKPGQRFTYAKVAPGLPLTANGGFVWGDFFQVAFGPDSKLNIVFTVDSSLGPLGSQNSEIYYARQL